MEDSRLASLIGLYIAGVLNADEAKELREWLAVSEEARAQFERHLSWYEITHPGTRLLRVDEFLAQGEEEETFGASFAVGRLSAQQLFHTAFYTWRGWSALTAFAAVVLFAYLAIFRDSPVPLPLFEPPITTSEGNVATLRAGAGVKWGNLTNEIFVGDTLATGRVQLAEGAIQLELNRGARLVIEAPADLQLISDNEAFLHTGKVTAHVPETAHGFKITTPTVAVTDLGTEFGLIARSSSPAEVHVFSGIVEATRPTIEPHRLTQGQGTRVQARRLKRINAQAKSFLLEDGLTRRVVAEQHNRYERWKNAARELGQDPAALIHYTFEDHADSARELANVGFGAPARSFGAISGCTWTSGRWPEKRALSFGANGDRIRFSVPNTLTSLTYVAWLRVDNLVNLSNALALTETMQLGEVHWQMYRDGRVALSSRSGSGSTVDQSWDRGLSPAIFTTNRLGKWTHLVSVYDSAARSIRHYVNGDFVSSTPIKRPVPLKLGAVEIGNWGVRVDEPKWASLKNSGPSYLNRHWTGSVDEFALLSRALTEDEIRRHYDQGRVSVGVTLAKNAP